MRNGRIKYFCLALLLVVDIGYSFLQHQSMPLDGDVAGGVVPEENVRPILADPLGISVFSHNSVYANPNRFFAHWSFYHYFQNVPIWLQNMVSPIDSIYLACALIKTIIQVSIIILLAFYITGKRIIFSRDFILAAVIIAPLFQTTGYRGMAIIDQSITYTFFYGLPCAILLFFYLPFFRSSFNGLPFLQNKVLIVILVVTSIFISLNGPLIPGIVLVISLVFFFNNWKKTYQSSGIFTFFERMQLTFAVVPKSHLAFFFLISALSIYSLYVGTHNSILIEQSIPLAQRYVRIPYGIYNLLTQKLGFPILFTVISINLLLVNKYFKNQETLKMIGFFKWIGLFSILYIILLPLGGYKTYRPFIIRYDTFMPITIALIFIYGMSSYYLIRNLKSKFKNGYLSLVIFTSLIYTWSDKSNFNGNKCEKESLLLISQAKGKTILVENDCIIMGWKKITDPKQSELNGQLLYLWGVTKEPKLYYQK
jgi:hypothetical protein